MVRRRVKTGATDDYGADVIEDRDTLVRWCSVEPTRSTEDQSRSAPAVAGVTLRAPAAAGPLIEASSAVVWPVTGESRLNGRTVYQGRQWEVVGDVGQWEGYVEVQLQKAS